MRHTATLKTMPIPANYYNVLQEKDKRAMVPRVMLQVCYCLVWAIPTITMLFRIENRKQEAYRPDSSAIYNRLSGHRKFTKSSNILLKITHLASRKSCLVIICPNSYEKLTKVKSGQIGVSSNIAQNHSSRKSYLVIIWPNSHEELIKIKIRSSWSRFEHYSESLI